MIIWLSPSPSHNMMLPGTSLLLALLGILTNQPRCFQIKTFKILSRRMQRECSGVRFVFLRQE
jgi:hypothetical protein